MRTSVQEIQDRLASAVGYHSAQEMSEVLMTRGTTDPEVVLLIFALMNEIATLSERYATATEQVEQLTIELDSLRELVMPLWNR